MDLKSVLMESQRYMWCYRLTVEFELQLLVYIPVLFDKRSIHKQTIKKATTRPLIIMLSCSVEEGHKQV